MVWLGPVPPRTAGYRDTKLYAFWAPNDVHLALPRRSA
jgi:hypothetical protein